MNEWSAWRLIKAGFWLGIGFIVPSLAVYALATLAVVGVTPLLMDMGGHQMESRIEENVDVANYGDRFDKTAQIKILEYAESTLGDQLLILGKIKNTGKDKVGSVQLEAELFGSAGEFVYECTEYVNGSLKAGEVENFQIKCGCKGQPAPEHTSLTVRVSSASTY